MNCSDHPLRKKKKTFSDWSALHRRFNQHWGSGRKNEQLNQSLAGMVLHQDKLDEFIHDAKNLYVVDFPTVHSAFRTLHDQHCDRWRIRCGHALEE